MLRLWSITLHLQQEPLMRILLFQTTVGYRVMLRWRIQQIQGCTCKQHAMLDILQIKKPLQVVVLSLILSTVNSLLQWRPFLKVRGTHMGLHYPKRFQVTCCTKGLMNNMLKHRVLTLLAKPRVWQPLNNVPLGLQCGLWMALNHSIKKWMTTTTKTIRRWKNSKSIPVSEFGREHPRATTGEQLTVAQ